MSTVCVGKYRFITNRFVMMIGVSITLSTLFRVGLIVNKAIKAKASYAGIEVDYEERFGLTIR